MQFLTFREQESNALKLKNEAKKAIQAYTLPDPKDEDANPNNLRIDGKGNRCYDFENPITIGDTVYKGLRNQRSVSYGIDVDAVRNFLDPEREGLDDAAKARAELLRKRVYKPTEEWYWDTDELYVLQQEGLISESSLTR